MSSKVLVTEIEFEKTSTQKLLELLPEDKLDWQPHPKAMTLGQLAFHVATIPGRIAKFANDGITSAEILIEHPLSKNKEDIVGNFNESIKSALEILNATTTDWDSKNWSCMLGEKEIINWSRPTLLRFLMLNHWYHHRGQLSTYLRILGVEIPSIYGPSADENPFA
ncbi:DinB family protein [Aquimarina sediminis]|uniref:DinB family protein n=1 Tax=Aquimarina sediminis TaxID=2070536 RepID=UPI000CA0573F|nr:DinB family protein [Aquimarina sediminis]